MRVFLPCFVRKCKFSHVLYTDLYNYGYLRIHFFFFQVVKHFEFPKALYKFPILLLLLNSVRVWRFIRTMYYYYPSANKALCVISVKRAPIVNKAL